MNNYIDVIQDQFEDYAFKEGTGPAIVKVEGLHTESLGSLIKGVKIGVAICNPVDEYNEKVGICRATARAEKADYTILSTSRGYINKDVVEAILLSEAKHVKDKPEQFIPGYADSRDHWMKKQEMEGIRNNFSEIERIVVEKIQEDPKFLNNVEKYLGWLINQKKGKCQKRGK